jgi:LuxR family maltose regulon positive regulatory protein
MKTKLKKNADPSVKSSLFALPLLRTKLNPPSLQPHIIPRPRLIQLLNEGLKCKLILISAPPGYGKTSLLSDWIQTNSLKTAWYTIDENDKNPLTFLTYTISSLQNINPSIGKAAFTSLQSPQPPPMESILTGLINDIVQVRHDLIFVLDDYHLIDTPPIQALLGFLIEHLPDNMHLIISSRSDPSLPLARVRSHHQLTEVRAADLCFNPEEISTLFNKKWSFGLSSGEIISIADKTEGWIAGLQLLGLSLQDRTDISPFIQAFQADNRYIADYLMEEVLNRQPEPVQDFLLQTAILQRLCGPLCDTITGQKNGQDMLNRLEKANLFLFPLDKERIWYRYHRLFSDLLLHRLEKVRGQNLAGLHLRAARWYQRQGMKEDALEHTLAARDYPQAARQIEDIVENFWDRGEQSKFLEWFKELPEEIFASNPRLSIYRARAMVMSGLLDEAERILHRAETALESWTGDKTLHEKEQLSPAVISREKKSMAGRLATIYALLSAYRGETTKIIQFSKQAIEDLDKKDLMWRSVAATNLGFAFGWSGIGDMMSARQAFSHALDVSRQAGNGFYAMFSELCLASIDGIQGRFEQAMDTFRRLLQIAEDQGLGLSSQAGTIYGSLANILLERGEWLQGKWYLDKGIEITEKGNDVAATSSNRLILAYDSMFNKNHTETMHILEQIERMAKDWQIPQWMTHVVSSLKAKIWVDQGDTRAVLRWIGQRELAPEKDIPYRREMEYSVLARFLISQRRFDEADSILNRMIENAESYTRISDAVRWRLIQVLSFSAQDAKQKAAEELKKALNLAEPGRFVRSFIAEGQPIAELLETIAEEEKAAGQKTGSRSTLPYLKRLSLAFKEVSHQKTELKDDLLSDRELEVLRLIASGNTNSEIAEKLYISINTVRSHTKSINSKLDTHNRMQAVARAKERRLL